MIVPSISDEDKDSHHNMKQMSRLGDKQFYDCVFAEFWAEIYDIFNPCNKIANKHISDRIFIKQIYLSKLK